MGRLVSAGGIVYDQLDYFSPPGSITRAVGVPVSALTMKLFFSNAETNWTLVDGTTVPDSSVCAGQVYFNETGLNTGFYSIRFFPDRVGFWRLVIRNVSAGVESIREYDVVPAGTFAPQGPIGGLNASFTKP